MNPVKLTLLIASLLFLNTAIAAQTLKFSKGWSPEAPPVTRVMAGYFTVKNSHKNEILITEISSPQFDNVEIHRTIHEGGMAKMRWQPHIHVPAGKTVMLEPGGKHLMLMKPKRRLKKGDTIELQITLSNNMTQTIQLSIK
ncbi:MAG: copper chaperone PCu(A)C [Gammaproteobacteria bacterium]|nr:copper chaperone PCu(A)C [Gammaproteobacteria bacterium]MDH5778202.1 copper chaperone PCu(A)C [Gammaproteobacteria bacterium]